MQAPQEIAGFFYAPVPDGNKGKEILPGTNNILCGNKNNINDLQFQ